LFNASLALIVFFWAGLGGVVAGSAHMLFSLIVLIVDLVKPERVKAPERPGLNLYA
jgi:hypothetical protein